MVRSHILKCGCKWCKCNARARVNRIKWRCSIRKIRHQYKLNLRRLNDDVVIISFPYTD